MLFDGIAQDLAVVRDAYRRAGLMTEAVRDPGMPRLPGRPVGDPGLSREVLLVDALLRHRVARLVFRREGTRHIVVFGGNNVGKSTVVNILAAEALADTSPEGGYTRHVRGFTTATEPLFAWNPYAFNGFRQVQDSDLHNAPFDCYAVVPVAAGLLPDGIALWDSPDCDSVGSLRYLAAVVEAAAAADLLVYVTSVEKYAVADLVDWVFDLSDAGIAILECLNKTPRRDRLLVIAKQNEDVFPAVERRLGIPAPSIRVVALRSMIEGEEADLWGPDHLEAAELRDSALAMLTDRDEVAEARAALDFVLCRIDRVLEPARAEISVRAAWDATVEEAVDAFVSAYEESYLRSESVIEPFRQLNAELLELLHPDIPVWSQTVRRIRDVQRIPVRLLTAAVRGVAGWMADRHSDDIDGKLAPELQAYAVAHRSLLASMHAQIEAERHNPNHHPFWDRLSAEWEREAVQVADEFSDATVAHIQRTNAEIKAAARDVLQALQKRPNVLMALQMARVSLDVSGLLVGFVIPGHGNIVHDLLEELVIAPAMLGATGYAAESAVEGYIAQRRARIVDKLLLDARDMAIRVYAEPLRALAEAVMEQVGSLGIPEALLDRIPADLLRLRAATAA